MTRRRQTALLGAAAAMAFAFAARRAAPPSGSWSFRDVELANFDGSRTSKLAACPTRRCFVAYVAPWCGYCRAATPLIKDLREVLRSRGIESWVVVGLDREPALKTYARDFGPDALVDARHAIEPGGVPHFFMVERGGNVLRHVSGLPQEPVALLAFALKD